MDIIYCDGSKAFDAVSHNILIVKLMKCGLDETTASWTENYQAQRTEVSGTKSSYRPRLLQ